MDQSQYRGIRPIIPLSLKPPSRKGLFGTRLSLLGIAHVSEEVPHGGCFKHHHNEPHYDHWEWGWPYDYENDLDYKTKVGALQRRIKGSRSNMLFLHELRHARLVLIPEFLLDYRVLSRSGPVKAPEPDSRDRSAYVWPSYIIWPNDPSYLSFLGSPETLELPKDVLRETRGHPEFRNEPSAHYRPGIQRPWRI